MKETFETRDIARELARTGYAREYSCSNEVC